ncbi:hypothetical protein D3C78_1105820 [compost metagenome]
MLGSAAGRTFDGDDVNLTGVALHARLDADARTDFVVAAARGTAQALGHGRRELVETLPGGVEFAGLRTLFGDPEAVVFEELTRHRPDFSRRTLGQDPTRAAALLQAEIADVGTGSQRLRTRHFELALDVVVGDVARNRQQRIEPLGTADVRWQLHRRLLGGLQIIAATVTEVTLFAPEPATTTGAGDDQGKGGKTSQSLHAVYVLN